MTPKDIFDFINANFTMRTNSAYYQKLNCFADAMRLGQYFPITEEEIRGGIEYKKAEGKALLKSLGFLISDEDKRKAEAMIETYCNQSLQQFLDYKHTHENSNNHVI